MNVLRHGCKSETFMKTIRNFLICKTIHNLAGLRELSYIK